MAQNQIRNPYAYYNARNKGKPIFNGSIFIGIADLDPTIVANQLTVTAKQEDGTEVPISQPIKTNSGGYPVDLNGNPVVLLVDGNHAIRVNDNLGNLAIEQANSIGLLSNDDLVVNGGTILTNDGTDVVFNYDTLNDAVISTTLVDGQALNIKERTSGNGGGAIWAVVLASTVTPDTFSIVQATGVPTLALVLRQYLSSINSNSDSGLESLSNELMSSGEGGVYVTTVERDILTYIELNGSKISSSGNTFAFDIIDQSYIQGADITTSSGVALNYKANATETIVISADLESTSASNAHTFNINTAGLVDNRIIGNLCNANGYAILANELANIDGLLISSNILNAGTGDAVEINAPSGASHKNIVVIGNILRADNNIGGNSGFGVGIAGGKNIAVVGNVGDALNGEAYHFEDDQFNNVLVGNTAFDCAEEGFFAQLFTGGLGEGLPAVGNSFRGAVGNSSPGMNHVFDVNGSLSGMAWIGNRIKSFDVGLATGQETLIADGNSVEDCATAISTFGGGSQYGLTLSKDCPTLVTTTRGTMVDSVISDSAVTTFLDTSSHTAGTIGSMVREFGFPLTGLSTVAAATWTQDLLPLPNLMRVNIIVRSGANNVNYIYTSAELVWDGTTLTTTNILRDSAGIFGSTVTFIDNAGNLAFTVFTASVQAIDLEILITGEYYKS